MSAVLLMALFPTTRTWGAPLPYTHSGDGGERVLTLSRSPGVVLAEILVPDDAGCPFEGFCFRRRGRGALRSPTSPRVTGCERVLTLSRSPGVILAEILVPDDAGCPFVDTVSDDAGVGRSAPLHPPRVTGCERVLTLSRSPGVVLAEILVPDDAGAEIPTRTVFFSVRF